MLPKWRKFRQIWSHCSSPYNKELQSCRHGIVHHHMHSGACQSRIGLSMSLQLKVNKITELLLFPFLARAAKMHLIWWCLRPKKTLDIKTQNKQKKHKTPYRWKVKVVKRELLLNDLNLR